jgi:hypothetical protein
MEALEQCMCPGCDRCMPPGGPCIRQMVSELDGRCQDAIYRRRWVCQMKEEE